MDRPARELDHADNLVKQYYRTSTEFGGPNMAAYYLPAPVRSIGMSNNQNALSFFRWNLQWTNSKN